MTFIKIYINNLGLVKHIVNQFLIDKDISLFEDLYQERCCALIKAIKTFNPSKGNKLSTYAYTVIHNQIYIYYYQHYNTIKIAKEYTKTYYDYQNFIEEYYTKNEKKPNNKECMEYLNISEDELNLIKKHPQFFPISIHTPIQSSLQVNENITIEDNIKDSSIEEQHFYQKIDNEILSYTLKKVLDPYEYYIIYHLYLSKTPKKQKDLYEELHLSQQSFTQKIKLY